MRRLLPLCLLAACASGPGGQDGQGEDAAPRYPFEGAWTGVGPAICGVPPGPEADSPVGITATEIVGADNLCAVVQVTAFGGGAYEVVSNCRSDGGAYQRRTALRLSPDGQTLTLQDEGNVAVTFARCPAA